MTGTEKIAQERAKQIHALQYGPEHDSEHYEHELVFAAICYAAAATRYERVYVEHRRHAFVSYKDPWPWPGLDQRPEPGQATEGEIERMLVKAGALIAAELDRLAAIKEYR